MHNSIILMNPQLAKQILYGAGFLTILFLFIFGVYFLYFKPAPTCFDERRNQGETDVDCGGPCLSCEIKTLLPPEILWLKKLPVNNQTIITAEIKNPNLDWGADFFNYSINIYDNDGKRIKTIEDNSFIYPAEIKYLLEPIEIDFKKIGQVKISFADFNWKSSKEFKKPLTQIKEIKYEKMAITGKIINNNTFELSKIRIFGFLYDQYGILSAASKTRIENINAFEEKFFKINFPRNLPLLNIDFNETKIYVEAVR